MLGDVGKLPIFKRPTPNAQLSELDRECWMLKGLLFPSLLFE